MEHGYAANAVRVIGYIWQPGVGICATAYTLDTYDVENIRDEAGVITRDGIEEWLAKNAGDFSEILDFEANIAGCEEFNFADEESIGIYHDAMYGEDA